jgi:hypothetical protein
MEQLRKLIRLVAIMLACACFAYIFSGAVWAAFDGGGEAERIQLKWTALGAICGVAVELWVRGWRPSRRIGIWGLLELTAIVAVIIAVLVTVSEA